MLPYIRQISACFMIALCSIGYAKDTHTNFKVDEITSFNGIPWGMAQLDDTHLLVTIKQGALYRVNTVTGKQTPISGLPNIANAGQGGLLDIALSPDFEETSWVYFTYSHPMADGATTALARAKLQGSALVDWQDIFITDAGSDTSKHFGSRIAFDNDGHVFISIGDRGERANAQDLTNHAGKILRLNLDGSVPKDNPFVRRGNVRAEIWSYGHRNPQGLYYDQHTQRLWSNEHGPRGGDEINLIRVGANYGWPIVSYGKEYWGPFQVGEGTSKEGIDEPKKVFTPSIAPGSLLVYRGQLFNGWDGDFLSTALALRHLNNVKLVNGNATESRHLEDLDERMRDVIELSDGALAISTDSGRILRILPASS